MSAGLTTVSQLTSPRVNAAAVTGPPATAMPSRASAATPRQARAGTGCLNSSPRSCLRILGSARPRQPHCECRWNEVEICDNHSALQSPECATSHLASSAVFCCIDPPAGCPSEIVHEQVFRQFDCCPSRLRNTAPVHGKTALERPPGGRYPAPGTTVAPHGSPQPSVRRAACASAPGGWHRARPHRRLRAVAPPAEAAARRGRPAVRPAPREGRSVRQGAAAPLTGALGCLARSPARGLSWYTDRSSIFLSAPIRMLRWSSAAHELRNSA